MLLSSLAVGRKKIIFRIQDTLLYIYRAKYVFLPFILVMHSFTHSLTLAHYLRFCQLDRTFELSTAYRYAISITNNNNDNERRRVGAQEVNEPNCVSNYERQWTTKKKRRNIPAKHIKWYLSEPSPSMDYKCWTCVKWLAFEIGLVLHPIASIPKSHSLCITWLGCLMCWHSILELHSIVWCHIWFCAIFSNGE